MNREIKFRAWDKEKGEMIPKVGVLPLGGVLKPDGETRVGDVGAYAKNYKYLHSEKIEVMQYTNLKDKNGEEIYEGDILASKLFHGDSGTWNYEVRWTEKNASFEINGYLIRHYDEVEIIGNIYENPNLLQ